MSIIDKFMGKKDEYEEEYEETGARQPETRDFERTQTKYSRPLGKNVIDFQDATAARNSIMSVYNMKVVVMEPTSFDDTQDIADCFIGKRPVIINIENTDIEIAKRIIDFASGVGYALNGEIKKVSKSVFLLAPNNVNISIPSEKKSDTIDWLGK